MKILLQLALSGIIFSASILSARTAWGQAGTLDPTFGTSGTVITNLGSSGVGLIDALQLQSNGDILVFVLAGANNEVARYTSTGALDPTFGNNGIAVLSPSLGSMT